MIDNVAVLRRVVFYWGSVLVLSLVLVACGRISFDEADALMDAPRPPITMTAIFTADNGYSVAWGAPGALGFLPGYGSITNTDIFACPLGTGPQSQSFTVVAPDTDYIYIAAWSDNAGTSGLVGVIIGNTRRLTGSTWEVCAIGTPYVASSTGPTDSERAAAIDACDAGSPTTASRGWVDAAGPVTPGAVGRLAVGDPNDGASGTFLPVCPPMGANEGVDTTARWIWYDPMDGMSAFTGNTANRTHTFHMYRLPAGD